MKFQLEKDIEGIGLQGDIIDVKEEDFGKIPFNVWLRQIDKIEDNKEIKDFETIKSTQELVAELVNVVGFSPKRATKITNIFKSKKELLDNLSKLPTSLEPIETETLVAYYGDRKQPKLKGGKQ